MRNIVSSRFSRFFVCLILFGSVSTWCRGQEFRLTNDELLAEFGPGGLVALTDLKSGERVQFARDEFELVVDQTSVDSARVIPTVIKEQAGLAYSFTTHDYSIKVVYELRAGWRFLTKRIEIVGSPTESYKLAEVEPLRLLVRDPITSSFTPATYLPQFGEAAEHWAERFTPRQYGIFLRFKEKRGLMLAVENPFLEVVRNGQDAAVRYRPEMTWRTEWGAWSSDVAVIGVYQQSGNRIPAHVIYEWKASAVEGNPGADSNEIQAYTESVRQFLLHPPRNPISVEVGWTLNDYQIDVATTEGRAEYKRVMDMASDLGIDYLLYAPSNHELALAENDVDDWNWEHVLWLGLGQKIRKGEWDVEKSPLPPTVREMLEYARSKHLGILAYVYPSLPFAQNPNWIVTDPAKSAKNSYATLASRDFQDFLIQELVSFKRRTGIAGYSFDYAFFNASGSSGYEQWRGWRRVLESLREAEPDIIIDGRQTYQMYGPWSWLAGNYPHPTGNDEQPESFTPYPDLHFDRVSADRTRFVNYWYKNYEFAPEEIVPGYMTHQTPRNRNVSEAAGADLRMRSEIVYAPFRRRDWDYLGYKYSVLSSIATASWNNVVDMIPARDPAEFEHFSATDKNWIREWLKWTTDNKEFLMHTRTILGQPAMGRVDGTAAIVGNRGFVFLFNPNYKALPAEFKWDASTGLAAGSEFVLKELYPEAGRLIAGPNDGLWKYGDVLSLALEGTSARVFELAPVSELEKDTVVFGLSSIDPRKPSRANLDNGVLRIEGAAGEIGASGEVSALLQSGGHLRDLQVNGKSLAFVQRGRYVSAPIKFAGTSFLRSQEITLHREPSGSFAGVFSVPNRIQVQLAKRRQLWPIPWTTDDYKTTWLVPERLLLFVQIADPNDSLLVKAELDGSLLDLIRAYSSVRENSRSFVGWYADVSKVETDKPHRIRLTLPELEPGRFQGLFFDNVEDEYTEDLAP
jgi:hypothetical protein